MKSIHLVITDLFLPKDIAAEVCADLRLPALEKMLVRGCFDRLSTNGEWLSTNGEWLSTNGCCRVATGKSSV